MRNRFYRAAWLILSAAFLPTNLMAKEIWETERGCLDFYHAYRPIAAGWVDHEFIGARWQSNESSQEKFFLFGLPKGNSDLQFFRSQLRHANSGKIVEIGGSCNLEKIGALLVTARQTSERLQKPHQNPAYYVVRMGITPLVGKPCGNAAQEIENWLRGQL